MDKQTEHALQNLLTGSASSEEVELLKQRLVSGYLRIFHLFCEAA